MNKPLLRIKNLLSVLIVIVFLAACKQHNNVTITKGDVESEQKKDNLMQEAENLVIVPRHVATSYKDWYFVNMTDGIYKFNKDFSENNLLDKGNVFNLYLIDNYLYFEKGEKICRIRTDNNVVEKVSDAYGSETEVIMNNCFFFLKDNDDSVNYALSKMKLDSNKKILLTDYIISDYKFTIYGNYIFYRGDYGDGFRGIYKTDYRKNTTVNIVNEKEGFIGEKYLFEDSWLYYTICRDGDYELHRIKEDGSNAQILVSDVTGEFSIKDDWIYFVRQDKVDTSELCKIKKDGSQQSTICAVPSLIFELEVINDRAFFKPSNKYKNIHTIKLDGTDLHKLNECIKDETQN